MYEGDEKVEYLSGWFLQFFAYYKDGDKVESEKIRVENFIELANKC